MLSARCTTSIDMTLHVSSVRLPFVPPLPPQIRQAISKLHAQADALRLQCALTDEEAHC
jgi:hypothetical protein